MDEKKIDGPDVPPVENSLEIPDELRESVESLVRSIADENADAIQQRFTSDTDNALFATLSEFLDSFAIIGYDFDGTPTVLSYAKTVQKREALDSLTSRYAMTIE